MNHKSFINKNLVLPFRRTYIIWFFLRSYLVSVAENKNLLCHPCESRGPGRKSWIPASAGMTNTVSTTGTNSYTYIRCRNLREVGVRICNIGWSWVPRGPRPSEYQTQDRRTKSCLWSLNSWVCNLRYWVLGLESGVLILESYFLVKHAQLHVNSA